MQKILYTVLTLAVCLGTMGCSTGFEKKKEYCDTRWVIVSRIYIGTSVGFDLDSAELTEAGKSRLDKIIKRARYRPNDKIVVAGFADITGESGYNQTLSERRAKSVADYLISQKARIARQTDVVGFGEKYPIVNKAGSADHAKSRRVEVIMYK